MNLAQILLRHILTAFHVLFFASWIFGGGDGKICLFSDGFSNGLGTPGLSLEGGGTCLMLEEATLYEIERFSGYFPLLQMFTNKLVNRWSDGNLSVNIIRLINSMLM